MSRNALSRVDLDDLLLRRFGQKVGPALRGTGVSLQRADEACWHFYGMSFSDKRDELWQAELKIKGRNNSLSKHALEWRGFVGHRAEGTGDDDGRHGAYRHRNL